MTTLQASHLPTLHEVLRHPVKPIKQAGLFPTYDQFEMFAYHMPQLSFVELIDLFFTLSSLNESLYFMCHLHDFREVAQHIDHIQPIALKVFGYFIG